MESTSTTKELLERAHEKVELGRDLIDMLQCFIDIPGAQKIQRKIQQEIKFLQKVVNNGTLKVNHITSSNLVHYAFLIKTLQSQRGILHIDCSFLLETRANPLRVDIVADNGLKWIKVIARNAKSLSDAAKGAVSYGARSILDQAQDYVLASDKNICMFQRPKIVFCFSQMVESSLLAELHKIGVDTAIDVTPADDLLHSSAVTSTLNLDITTMIAYISALCNGGANWRFQEKILSEQAERERKLSVKGVLDKLFVDKRLICCELAHKSFHDIVTLLAGPNERERAAEFLKRVEVFPDVTEIPQELSAIQFSGKINERSLKIFSFGMYMKAVTVTSNKAFVRSAKMQGINVPVYIHASRALTENKQSTGTKIE